MPNSYSTEPPKLGRGGARPGAGRRPSSGARRCSVRSYTLDDRTVAAIAAWQAEHQCSSASEALRQIVESVAAPT